MIQFLKDQKTHIMYGIIILALAGFTYNLFIRKPAEIIKTITETKVVNKNVVKTQVKYVDRVITKTEKDGTITTTTEHTVTDNTFTDKTKSADMFVSKTTTIYLSRYSLEVQYPIKVTTIGVFNPKEVIFTGGYRLFNFPIFVTLGTNIGFDSLLIGVRYEF